MKAIIDLGTNTFHLLIASIEQGELKELAKLQIPVKIGEGGINEGKIGDKAYQRGMNALALFYEKLNEYKADEVIAFGTSAIRDAQNGQQFIAEAKQRFNITIQAIDGDKEAEYIYAGVRHSFSFPDEPVLVMDIGGGSVEFIIGQQEKILWKKSYPIGAARLIEKFHRHEPILANEVKELNEYLTSTLVELTHALQQFPATVLIGSAGSFETLGEVVQKDLGKPVVSVSAHALQLSLDDFELFYQSMITKNKEERNLLSGMADFRVEMIVVSAILMHVIIHCFNMKQLIVSGYSLKEGMLFSRY